MTLTINGQEIEYISDYPGGWMFISNDPFKFPVVINSQDCFIKRFESKTPGDISGWELLQQLKRSPQPNLPRIFDTQQVIESENGVSYVFYEYLEGKTLDQIINEHGDIDLRRLMFDIFKSLEAIHNCGFWFADFCEKNIFCEKSGRYVLVDLDSAQPKTAVPTNDMYGSKDYWIPVYKFYKKILNQPGIRLSDINGMGLDYLQLIFLILHLKIFKESGRVNYRSEEEYNLLPSCLNNLDVRFQLFFTHVLSSGTVVISEEIINTTRKLIEEKIINNTMNSNTGASKGAIIDEFSSSNKVAKSGEPFILSWKVDADRVDLFRNGVFFQVLGNSQRSIERTEFYDSDKDVTYELVAYKDGVQSRSSPIIIKSASAVATVPAPSFDGVATAHIITAASWARFVAVSGIAFCCLFIIIACIPIVHYMAKGGSDDYAGMGSVLILLALIQLIPMIFLLRFANKLKPGLIGKDNNSLTGSFKNIKYYFIYMGIINVIFFVTALIITVMILEK